MRVDALPGGREQPFYHVLVDVRDRPGPQTTYVAQARPSIHRGRRGRGPACLTKADGINNSGPFHQC